MAAAVTKSLHVSVKFFLVLVRAMWLVALGILPHIVTQGFMFVPPVHQCPPHVVSKALGAWDRMGDHTRERFIVRAGAGAQYFHPGSFHRTIISAREAKM